MERNLQMVDLKAQMKEIREEISHGLAGVLDTCSFINGPSVREFSSALSKYLDVRHVIPCGNGTDALQVALMSLGLKPGDEVIVPSFTFIATTEVIALLGLIPRYAEVDAQTFNMDPRCLDALLTDRTRAIVPVHLYGQSAPMEEIMGFAQRHDLFVIEDNAQAIGATYQFLDGRTQKLGSIGHIGCTSFYPSKNLGAYGDAGAMMSQDDALGEKLQMMVNHGMERRYYHDEIGVNSRLDSFQAVVLNAKLKRLDAYNQARVAAADLYDHLLDGVHEVVRPYRAPYSTHVFHQYTLQAEDRDGLAKYLSEMGVPNMIYYPVPVHRQSAYEAWYSGEDLSITEELCEKVISLPMHSNLKAGDQEYIAQVIKDYYTK